MVKSIYSLALLKMVNNFVYLLVLITLVVLWGKCKISHYIPSSVFAVLMGMLVSFIWKDIPFHFAPEFFMYMLLPPILLQSAFEFNLKSLRQTWLPSLMFAIPGTLLSVVVIAGGIYVWTDEIDLITILIFAAILAPTDTVATLALRNRLQYKGVVLDILENESVMNDAISVALVHILVHIQKNADSVSSGWLFSEIVLFSILNLSISGLIGITASYLVNRMSSCDISLHYLISLLLYGAGESVGISGIVTLFVYGSVVQTPIEFQNTVGAVSSMMESYVYLMLGFALPDFDFSWLSLLVLVTVLMSRIVVVFFLGTLLHLCGYRQLTIPKLLFFSLCGVRGAISYALCLEVGTPFQKSTTFVVVMSTIICMGSLQGCMHHILLTI